MKKIGIFSFIYFLLSAFTFYMVGEGEGAGGGESNAPADTKGGGANEPGGDVGDITVGDVGDASITADELKEFRAMSAQHRESQMVTAVEKSIQTRIPDFSAEKTLAGLRELAKTDPAKAAYYNSGEAGWEMYHRDVTAKVAQGDAVNSGSHAGSGDFSSTLEKARSGDKKSAKEALAQSRA